MQSTRLLAELLVVGTLTLIGLLGLYSPPGGAITSLTGALGASVTIQVLAFSALAYVLGFCLSVLSEVAVSPLKTVVEKWYLKDKRSLSLDGARYELYTSGLELVVSRLEYHRSWMRLSRSLLLASVLFLLLVAPADLASELRSSLLLTLLAAIVTLAFAYARRVWWFTKTTYLSWLALDNRKRQELRASSLSGCSAVSPPTPSHRPRVVLLAGGTASRGISQKLSRRSSSFFRVVPVCDNGGSSEKLRKTFRVLPVGDIRHALIALASHREPRRPVVRLCNWRFPTGTGTELATELEALTDGSHPLMSAVEPDVRGALMSYLRSFSDELPSDFDLANGSVGNFVLIGAYLAHNKSMTTAIFSFRKICGISAQVAPVSLENDLHLGAQLVGISDPVLGQAQITKLDRSEQPAPIDRVFLTRSLSKGAKPTPPALPNPIVLNAISRADLLVFGPGSFFTSVLPHFFVESMADTIANAQHVPKVLLANLTESQETFGLTHEMLLLKFFDVIEKQSAAPLPRTSYLTHVLVNTAHEPHTFEGNRRYLPNGNLDRFKRDGIEIISADLEDVWVRGTHDADQVAERLLGLV